MRSDCWVSALTLALALGTVLTQRVYAADTLRLVVRIASAADRALLPRLRGQLSDVDAQLVVIETAPLEAALAEQLATAHTLASQHAADAVVWCVSATNVPTAQPKRVHIAMPRSERILTRTLTSPDVAGQSAFSSSELETAALLVRSVLVALSRSSELGEPTQQAVANAALAEGQARGDSAVEYITTESQAPAEPAPEPASTSAQLQPPAALQTSAPQQHADASVRAAATQAADAPEPLRPSDSSTAEPKLRARVSLAAHLALDGQSSGGQRGVYVRAGLSSGLWALSVFGVVSLASQLDDPHFTLSVSRHAAGVSVERSLPISDALQLGLALHGGTLLLRRSSRALSAAAISYPASLIAAFAFGPELALRWLHGFSGVGVRLGLDILPAAPRFESSGLSPEHSQLSHQLWTFEPRIALGWEAVLP